VAHIYQCKPRSLCLDQGIFATNTPISYTTTRMPFLNSAKKQDEVTDQAIPRAESPEHIPEKRTWYRTTLFNAFVIGTVGFMAPGLWNAMNSLGAGGAQSPFLINAANALVFGLSKIFLQRQSIDDSYAK